MQSMLADTDPERMARKPAIVCSNGLANCELDISVDTMSADILNHASNV